MSRVVARHEPRVLGQFGPSPHGELTSRVSIRRSGPNHLPPQGMAMCGRRRKVLRPDRPHPRPTRDPLRTDQNGLFSSPVPRWLLGSRTAVLLLTGPLLVVYNAEKVADNSQLLLNPFHSLTYLLRRIAFAGTHHAGWLRTRDASWLRPSRLRPTITKTGLRPRWMWRRSRRCRCSGLTLTPNLNPNP